MSVHFARIPAGTNPGGLWVRLCTEGELLDEHPLGFGEEGLADGKLALDYVDLGETVFGYVYDGDSGECVCTLVVVP